MDRSRALCSLLVLCVLGGAGVLWLLGRAGDPSATEVAAERDHVAPAAGPELEASAGAQAAAQARREQAAPGSAQEATETADDLAGPGRPGRVLVHVQDADSRPLAGARVVLAPLPSGPERAVLADAAGDASFDGVEAADVRLDASCAGFLTPEAPEEHYGLRTGDLHRVDLVLEPAARVEGRVIDASSGHGVAGALVRSRGGGTLGDMSSDGGRASYGEAATDAEGRFHLETLPLDLIVTLWAEAEGYARAESPVLVRRGSPASPVELRLESGGWLEATVTDAQGRPVAQARVQMSTPHDDIVAGGIDPLTDWGPDDYDSMGAETFEGTTDALGRCRILGIPLERRWVIGATHGHAASEALRGLAATAAQPRIQATLVIRSATLVIDLSAATRSGPLAMRLEVAGRGRPAILLSEALLSVRISVPPGPCQVVLRPQGFLRQRIELDLAPGATAERKLLLVAGETIAGEVVDDRGRPIPGAFIGAGGRDDDGPQGTSDAQGHFSITGLARGERTLFVWAAGHARSTLEHVSPPSSDLRLVCARLARVRARLTLPPGAPIPAEVMLWFTNADESGATGNPRAWTPDEVTWEVDTGPRSVRVSAEGYATWERRVDLAPGAELDLGAILLDHGSTIEGWVLSAGGAAVPDAHVEVYDGVEVRNVRTDAQGAFRVLGLNRRRYRVTAEPSSHVWARQDVEAGTGGPLTFRLVRGGLILGDVRRSTGGSARGVDVVVRCVEPGTDPQLLGRGAWPSTDPQGRFRARVLPGSYVVEVRRGEEVLAQQAVLLAEGDETPVLLTLRP